MVSGLPLLKHLGLCCSCFAINPPTNILPCASMLLGRHSNFLLASVVIENLTNFGPGDSLCFVLPGHPAFLTSLSHLLRNEENPLISFFSKPASLSTSWKTTALLCQPWHWAQPKWEQKTISTSYSRLVRPTHVAEQELSCTAGVWI